MGLEAAAVPCFCMYWRSLSSLQMPLHMVSDVVSLWCRHAACLDVVRETIHPEAAAIATAILQKTREFETSVKVCSLLCQLGQDQHLVYLYSDIALLLQVETSQPVVAEAIKDAFGAAQQGPKPAEVADNGVALQSASHVAFADVAIGALQAANV